MNEFKLVKESKITSGFIIPDHYFDGLSAKVIQQLPAAEPKVISLWMKSKKCMYAVAAVLVLSLSIPFLYSPQDVTNPNSDKEIENYLSYHSTLTDDDIVELMDKEDIEALNIQSPIEDNEMEDILTDNANLEHYIIN